MELNISVKPDPDSILAPVRAKCDHDSDRNHPDAINEDPSAFLQPIKDEKIESEDDGTEFITEVEHYVFLDEKIDLHFETEETGKDVSAGEDFIETVKQETEYFDSDYSDAETAETITPDGRPSIGRVWEAKHIKPVITEPMSTYSINIENNVLDVDTYDTGRARQRKYKCGANERQLNPVAGTEIKLNTKMTTSKGGKMQKQTGHFKRNNIETDKDVSARQDFIVTVKQEMEYCDFDCSDAETAETITPDGRPLVGRVWEMKHIKPVITYSINVENNNELGVDTCDTGPVCQRKYKRGVNEQQLNPVADTEIKLNTKTKTSKGGKRQKRSAGQLQRNKTCDNYGPVCQRKYKRGANEQQLNPVADTEIKLNTKTKTSKGGKRQKRTAGQLKRNKIEKKKFLCDVCRKIFDKKSDLSVHVRSHSGVKPYECRMCKKTFSQLGNLNTHAKIHSGEKPYACQVCKLSFAQFSHLRRHARGHAKGKGAFRILAGEKPFECQVCKKNLRSASALIVHARTHTGEKPYACPVCSKAFAYQSNLTVHGRVHTGEKPYKCQVCEMAFSISSHLKQHARVHTGERPYKCHGCDKTFSRLGTLNHHARIHTSEK